MNSDPRLKDIIGSTTGKEAKIRLIGFPSDEGVKMNGGRPGASEAPEAIYSELLKLTPHPQYLEQNIRLLETVSQLFTAGCSGDVQADQEKLGEVVSDVLKNNQIPVIFGGGHETSFGHFLGYAKYNRAVHILNIDAHADVRKLKNGKPHSGSPFRQAAEHSSSACRSYSVFGLNPSSVSRTHIDYIEDQGLAVFEKNTSVKRVLEWFEDTGGQDVMVTMDMDAVQQADAPGVSAPNASGLSKRLWLDLAFEFGRQPGVTSFDLCEVNPSYDIDSRTTCLAALTIWYFLLGLSHR